MLELTAKIILIGSVAGMGLIVVRKIPLLRELSVEERRPLDWGEKIKILSQKVSQKVFSKINFSCSLGERRKQAFSFLSRFAAKKKKKEKETNLSDDYWKKIRKG